MNKRLSISMTLILFVQGLPTALFGATPAPPHQGVAVQTTPNAGATPKPAPAYASYQFYGDRYRDPFIPLTADVQSDRAADIPPQITSLILKGIVQDARGRMALISSGASSYILRGGYLYNSRNRRIKKMTGVIKADSVVIIGADRTVREIRVKSNL